MPQFSPSLFYSFPPFHLSSLIPVRFTHDARHLGANLGTTCFDHLLSAKKRLYALRFKCRRRVLVRGGGPNQRSYDSRLSSYDDERTSEASGNRGPEPQIP